MNAESLLIEWIERCGRYGVEVGDYPTPDYWHDIREQLEYARASISENTPDKEIADNVRACLWLTDIGARWEALLKRPSEWN